MARFIEVVDMNKVRHYINLDQVVQATSGGHSMTVVLAQGEHVILTEDEARRFMETLKSA